MTYINRVVKIMHGKTFLKVKYVVYTNGCLINKEAPHYFSWRHRERAKIEGNLKLLPNEEKVSGLI